jgi:thiol-disulfide isomerase/thioredoxin
MKQLFYFLVMCLPITACQQKSTLSGIGTSAKSDIYVYDIAKNRIIDTIKVDGGNFSCTLETVDEPKLLLLTDKSAFTRYVVAEKSHLTFIGDTGRIKGGVLNGRMADFLEIYGNLARGFDEKKTVVLGDDWEGEDLTEDLLAKLHAIEEEESASMSEVIKQYYETDRENIVGALELMFFQQHASDEEFMAMYEQGGATVKNYPIFLEIINREKTKAGAKYPDFEGVNPTDTAQVIRLSDFAGKGKYVLLDFWASWCGPCKAAMPDVKKLNDKYAGKGLEVIGVVIGDNLDDHLRSAKALNITWTQIFDQRNSIGALYGINAIPTLILLDRDGTILMRTHEKEEIAEKIQSLLN